MQVMAYCEYLRVGEYNGQPQMYFRDPDKSMWNEFHVTYNKGSFPSEPEKGKPKWYKFRADEYKFNSNLREFLGEDYS